MRLSLRVLSIAAGLILCSVSASAFPRVWTLSGVTFSDGGTASGSFTYDATTNTYSNINITTTAGSVILTGANYTFFSTVGVTPSASGVLFNASNAADLTGTRGFALFFSPSLASTNTAVDVTGQEATCSNATCAAPVPPSRSTTAGAVTAAAAAVPTLSFPMLGLLALALLGASLFLIRKL